MCVHRDVRESVLAHGLTGLIIILLERGSASTSAIDNRVTNPPSKVLVKLASHISVWRLRLHALPDTIHVSDVFLISVNLVHSFEGVVINSQLTNFNVTLKEQVL